jgi:cephalosporin hydroxylase
MGFSRILYSIYQMSLARPIRSLFFQNLIAHTHNFGSTRWMNQPIWQNVLDLWTIQETLCEIRPELLIECGTNRGGSSLFYAHLFDLLNHGRVVTIDVAKMHDHTHPRVTYLLGSSTAPDIVERVKQLLAEVNGPILVILDSEHSQAHVRRELDCYAPFVTPGSFCLVQDGVIDTLWMFRGDRPGPLPAIKDFLRTHPEFEIDEERERRFLVTHHPMGWLRRKLDASG